MTTTQNTPVAWAILSLVHFGIVGGSFPTLADAEQALAGMEAVCPTVPLAANIIGLTADGRQVGAR